MYFSILISMQIEVHASDLGYCYYFFIFGFSARDCLLRLPIVFIIPHLVILQIKQDSLEAVGYFVAVLQSPYETSSIESVQTAASLVVSATSVASYITEDSAVRNYITYIHYCFIEYNLMAIKSGSILFMT